MSRHIAGHGLTVALILGSVVATEPAESRVRVANTIAPDYTVTNEVNALGPVESGLIGPVALLRYAE